MFHLGDTSTLFLRADSEQDVTLIRVFIGFQLFGLIGSIIMLATVLFSSTARRHPTWHNFTISWIISCISYTLLFLAGQQNAPSPSFELCFAQTALIYAAPPMTAAATLGLVIQIWFSVGTVVMGPKKNEKIGMVFIMILPYLLHVSIVIESLIDALQHPDSIRKVTGSGMYCNSKNPVPGRVSTGLVTLLLIPTVVFEVLIVLTLRRHWPRFRSKKHALSMIIRVFLFSVLGVFSIGLSLAFFFTVHHGAELNIVVSILPVAAVLIFGTQSDIIETWMFWKRRGRDMSRWKELPDIPREECTSA